MYVPRDAASGRSDRPSPADLTLISLAAAQEPLKRATLPPVDLWGRVPASISHTALTPLVQFRSHPMAEAVAQGLLSPPAWFLPVGQRVSFPPDSPVHAHYGYSNAQCGRIEHVSAMTAPNRRLPCSSDSPKSRSMREAPNGFICIDQRAARSRCCRS
jgi:hypothetical protein